MWNIGILPIANKNTKSSDVCFSVLLTFVLTLFLVFWECCYLNVRTANTYLLYYQNWIWTSPSVLLIKIDIRISFYALTFLFLMTFMAKNYFSSRELPIFYLYIIYSSITLADKLRGTFTSIISSKTITIGSHPCKFSTYKKISQTFTSWLGFKVSIICADWTSLSQCIKRATGLFQRGSPIPNTYFD